MEEKKHERCQECKAKKKLKREKNKAEKKKGQAEKIGELSSLEKL